MNVFNQLPVDFITFFLEIQMIAVHQECIIFIDLATTFCFFVLWSWEVCKLMTVVILLLVSANPIVLRARTHLLLLRKLLFLSWLDFCFAPLRCSFSLLFQENPLSCQNFHLSVNCCKISCCFFFWDLLAPIACGEIVAIILWFMWTLEMRDLRHFDIFI